MFSWRYTFAGKGVPGTTVADDQQNPYRKNAKFSTPLDDARTQITQG